MTTLCAKCGSPHIDYLSSGRCFCHECNEENDSIDRVIETPYERTRRYVYAPGNKWAIENFNATHN